MQLQTTMFGAVFCFIPILTAGCSAQYLPFTESICVWYFEVSSTKISIKRKGFCCYFKPKNSIDEIHTYTIG